MDARTTKGAVVLALVVPLLSLAPTSAGAATTDRDPTYRAYTMPSPVNNGTEVEMYCEGDKDNRDSAIGVNGQNFPGQAQAGEILYEGGRIIGFRAAANFTLNCQDDHTSAHDFDLP